MDGNPEAKPDERYKAIVREAVDGKETLKALASADGVHWRRLRDEPVLDDPPFDTQNVPFWDPWRGEYVIYVRGKRGAGGFTHGRASEGPGRESIRWIRRGTSKDFLNWSSLERYTPATRRSSTCTRTARYRTCAPRASMWRSRGASCPSRLATRTPTGPESPTRYS